jgi:cell cycle protein kinase DBF2
MVVEQIRRIHRERQIMQCVASRWLTPLRYALQDSTYLYLVMDFLPGGDLGMLLRNVGAFDEAHARFYAAEMVIAVDQLHKLSFIHRDLKPENFMIDRSGHLKLIDFGLATSTHTAVWWRQAHWP